MRSESVDARQRRVEEVGGVAVGLHLEHARVLVEDRRERLVGWVDREDKRRGDDALRRRVSIRRPLGAQAATDRPRLGNKHKPEGEGFPCTELQNVAE
mgnify:CR=1 FL=1